MAHQESRFEDIETKLSFQEHLLENLNDALTGQQRQLDELQRQITKISDMMESTQEDQADNSHQEAPPPHY
jgi:SlyX protein